MYGLLEMRFSAVDFSVHLRFPKRFTFAPSADVKGMDGLSLLVSNLCYIRPWNSVLGIKIWCFQSDLETRKCMRSRARRHGRISLYLPFSSASLNSFTLLFAYFLVSIQFHSFYHIVSSHSHLTSFIMEWHEGI